MIIRMEWRSFWKNEGAKSEKIRWTKIASHFSIDYTVVDAARVPIRCCQRSTASVQQSGAVVAFDHGGKTRFVDALRLTPDLDELQLGDS